MNVLSPFASNPVQTRDELASFLTGMLDALAPHTSPGGALIHLGFTGTHFDERAALLEGFSRPVWGLASLLAGGGTYDGTGRWVNGFAHGSDPEDGEFWGNMRDRDQRMVECSAIGFSIAVAREQLWDPLTDTQKRNFEKWLGGMNDKEMPNTNWLWFRVFSNLGLSRAGSPLFDAARMKADMDHLDTFYIGEGWSRDGPEGVVQLDYYSSSFAIQFAQLVYSKLAQKDDPERCEEFRNRAKKFALDFVHYFDEEGRAIPFGRSLTYRFAMSSFWGALAFADVDLPAPLTWGHVKGLQLRNVRYWAHQAGAYNSDGTLTIGFNYPNLNITENYNSPGSPYWCCKSFITLSLPPTHPFWLAEELPFPTELRSTVKSLEKPLHIASNVGGHTLILSSGQQCSYPVKQSAAKYGKFAYSSAFGYSVPTGLLTIEEHAADSTLALTDDDGETYKVRRVTREARIERSRSISGLYWLRSMWYPWSDVEVETWLVPPQADVSPLWHLRVHRIRTARKLGSAEGGWAIHGQGPDFRALDLLSGADAVSSREAGVYESNTDARAVSSAGVSGIVELSRSGVSRTAKVLRTDPNSNLVVPRAVLPTLFGGHEAEADYDSWLVTAVFGVPVDAYERAEVDWLKEWDRRPLLPDELAVLITS